MIPEGAENHIADSRADSESEDYKYQAKVLSAIRKGLETSLVNALETIKSKNKEIEKLKWLCKYAMHEWALANGWEWDDYEDIYCDRKPFGQRMNKTQMWEHFIQYNNL